MRSRCRSGGVPTWRPRRCRPGRSSPPASGFGTRRGASARSGRGPRRRGGAGTRPLGCARKSASDPRPKRAHTERCYHYRHRGTCAVRPLGAQHAVDPAAVSIGRPECSPLGAPPTLRRARGLCRRGRTICAEEFYGRLRCAGQLTRTPRTDPPRASRRPCSNIQGARFGPSRPRYKSACRAGRTCVRARRSRAPRLARGHWPVRRERVERSCTSSRRGRSWRGDHYLDAAATMPTRSRRPWR